MQPLSPDASLCIGGWQDCPFQQQLARERRPVECAAQDPVGARSRSALHSLRIVPGHPRWPRRRIYDSGIRSPRRLPKMRANRWTI
jgi:hypothetical protein